mmetsp:Transcript_45887/g.109521  ORF Transcript_45887/g.109521 Transcript_45887/m.109521 type:complete len:292 (-) Transcript_45887:256-1131(-)
MLHSPGNARVIAIRLVAGFSPPPPSPEGRGFFKGPAMSARGCTRYTGSKRRSSTGRIPTGAPSGPVTSRHWFTTTVILAAAACSTPRTGPVTLAPLLLRGATKITTASSSPTTSLAAEAEGPCTAARLPTPIVPSSSKEAVALLARRNTRPFASVSMSWNTSLNGPDEALESDLMTPSVRRNSDSGSKPRLKGSASGIMTSTNSPRFPERRAEVTATVICSTACSRPFGTAHTGSSPPLPSPNCILHRWGGALHLAPRSCRAGSEPPTRPIPLSRPTPVPHMLPHRATCGP